MLAHLPLKLLLIQNVVVSFCLFIKNLWAVGLLLLLLLYADDVVLFVEQEKDLQITLLWSDAGSGGRKGTLPVADYICQSWARRQKDRGLI